MVCPAGRTAVGRGSLAAARLSVASLARQCTALRPCPLSVRCRKLTDAGHASRRAGAAHLVGKFRPGGAALPPIRCPPSPLFRPPFHAVRAARRRLPAPALASPTALTQ